MSSSNPTIIDTNDGSHSLHSTRFNQQYHSHHGAIAESIHVFLEAGLADWFKGGIYQQPLRIGELGFGGGLNAYLTRLEAEKQEIPVTYEGLELYPVPLEQALKLNYPEKLGQLSPDTFAQLHESSWNVNHSLSPFFEFKKVEADHLKYAWPAEQLHTFFFDAFAFDAQPELWTQESYRIVYDALIKGGYFVTYAAKGVLKRDLTAVGFEVQTLPGAPGKREMVRAVK